ncbi:MAG: type II toxin-antitoxin system VapC family toxin [Terriglobia bacterium]
MPNYFVDTSALAKVYHQEAGAEFMRRIISDPASRSFVSHLAIVEMESVLSIKARTGEIDERQVETARRCLRADLSQRRLLVALPIQPRHFHAARLLLVKYGAAEGLRTLDALQLAVALDLKDTGQIAVLIAADQRLCRVATLAGCPAANPEQPSPTLI